MERKSLRERFNEEGYIYLPKLYSGEQLEKLLGACNRVLDKYTEEWDKKNPGKDFHQIRNIHNPKLVQNIEDMKTILETAADPRCIGPVEQIFETQSLFRATTYWMNPRFVSLEGHWHRDTQNVNLTEEDEKKYIKNLMDNDLLRGVQFQIALVDNVCSLFGNPVRFARGILYPSGGQPKPLQRCRRDAQREEILP